MSDSLIPFQPAIDEPSNILPSSKKLSSTVLDGTVTCCSLPRVSVSRKSTNLTPFSFIICNTSAADMSLLHSCLSLLAVDPGGRLLVRGARAPTWGHPGAVSVPAPSVPASTCLTERSCTQLHARQAGIRTVIEHRAADDAPYRCVPPQRSPCDSARRPSSRTSRQPSSHARVTRRVAYTCALSSARLRSNNGHGFDGQARLSEQASRLHLSVERDLRRPERLLGL